MQLKKWRFPGILLFCASIVLNCGDDDVRCPDVQILCPGMGTMICVTPTIDKDNCGTCGNRCAIGEQCVNGMC